jgi:hypothetical protein
MRPQHNAWLCSLYQLPICIHVVVVNFVAVFNLAGKDPAVKIWDVEAGQARISLEAFGGLVQARTLLPYSMQVATYDVYQLLSAGLGV